MYILIHGRINASAKRISLFIRLHDGQVQINSVEHNIPLLCHKTWCKQSLRALMEKLSNSMPKELSLLWLFQYCQLNDDSTSFHFLRSSFEFVYNFTPAQINPIKNPPHIEPRKMYKNLLIPSPTLIFPEWKISTAVLFMY